MSTPTERPIYDKFFNEYANELLGKSEEYAEYSLDGYADSLGGLYLVYLSLAEGDNFGDGDYESFFADGDERWELLLARHTDAELRNAAALLSVTFGIWIGTDAETTVPQAALLWREAIEGSSLVRSAARLADEIWGLAHGAAFTERDSWGEDRPVPRRERLPQFWSLPPFLLTHIEAARDVHRERTKPETFTLRQRREGLRGH